MHIDVITYLFNIIKFMLLLIGREVKAILPFPFFPGKTLE